MDGAREKMQPQKRGRPAIGKGTPVQVRLQPDLLARLDAYRATLPDEPSRPEAIRGMIEALLHIVEKDPANSATD